MMSPDQAEDVSSPAAVVTGGLFDVVCVPIRDYERHPRLDADDEAERVTSLFARLGGRASPWELSAGQARTATVVNARLRSWSQSLEARNSVLFWVGHGQANPDGAWLAIYDTPDAMDEGGILPEHLAGFITAEWQRRAQDDEAWAIVVIEACGAERFANLLHSALLRKAQPPSRFAVVGVGADDGAGQLGEFRQALDETLFRSNAYTDADDEIKLSDLLDQVAQRLQFGIVHAVKLYQAPPIPRPRRLPAPVASAMDVYVELQQFVAGLSPDERGHFLPKAQGADHAEVTEPAWYFVGREAERAQIAAWLRTHPAGMLIVTGRAGSGKSALLGHVLIHATPGLRDLLIDARLMRPAPTGEFPDDLRFDAVIHLSGMTIGGLARRLADAADLGESPVLADSGQNIGWVLDGLARRRRPFTVMADALDEAQEPATLASAVLRRLAALDQVRVVVGTRTSTREGPGLPEPDDQDLIDALGRTAEVLTVQRDPEAVGRYVQARLTAAQAAAVIDADDQAIAEIARQVQAMNQDFLYARLAIHEIIANPGLLRA